MEKNHARCVLGNNILRLRKHYTLSRSSLARLIRIPVGRLRRIEQGDPKAKLYDFHLYRLAKVFDVPMESLLKDGTDSRER